MNRLFKGLFDTTGVTTITVPKFLLCVGVALLIGIMIAAVYTFRSRYTKSFVVTLAMLPAIVCVVILMVNGNVGAGVAVAGAFSLVRFRSVPGTAKEIGTIFLAMGSGLIAGMGYLAYAILFTIILCAAMICFSFVTTKMKNTPSLEKTLRITIPEDLNYGNVFDDLFEKYTKSSEIVSVKTTNMGSMFKLQYNIILNDIKQEKEFIDELRCRNGNLEISISKQEVNQFEL